MSYAAQKPLFYFHIVHLLLLLTLFCDSVSICSHASAEPEVRKLVSANAQRRRTPVLCASWRAQVKGACVLSCKNLLSLTPRRGASSGEVRKLVSEKASQSIRAKNHIRWRFFISVQSECSRSRQPPTFQTWVIESGKFRLDIIFCAIFPAHDLNSYSDYSFVGSVVVYILCFFLLACSCFFLFHIFVSEKFLR